MTLTFYHTPFDVTKNGIYEDLDTFLEKLTITGKTEYKHIDPALSVTVKLPVSSHQKTKDFVGDYCKAEDDDGTIYYYYVMNSQWKGKETLLVTLGLDTLNTFKTQIDGSITSETHITRQFKNRWGKRGVASSRYNIWPIIDRREEEFSVVPMIRKSVETVNPSASTRKWTLVYVTRYDQSETNLAENPVDCYAYPSASVNISTSRMGDVTWGSDYWGSNYAWALSSSESGGAQITIGGLTFSVGAQSPSAATSFWLIFSATYKKFYLKRFLINYNAEKPTWLFYETEGDSVTFNNCAKIYRQDFDYADGLKDSNEAKWPREGTMDLSQPVEINAGASYTSLIDFGTWYESNKTDGRLIKIRELPYAPFDETYTDGVLNVPSGWEISGNRLKFTGTTFGIRTLASTSTSIAIPTAADIVDKEPDMSLETKLYNSSFRTDKLVYDTNAWVAKWENATSHLKGLNLDIKYAVSDGMDNGSLFQITTPFEYDSDFGDVLTIDKSTDKPYYTNEYLNYLRYGKAVDEKSVNFSAASTVVSSVGSIASTIASTAFGFATANLATAGVGAAIGAAVGVVTAAMSIAKTASTAYDSINAKIDAYTHQASSVSGTSDVSLFNIYSGNKLLEMHYEPRDEIKQMLFDYFRLYGYADDVYEKPTCTRRYVDYFKCEPVFSRDFLWDEFKDDIKQRMQIGYRVFHLVDNSYDLTFSKENWETSLWDWAH